jgi:glycosyltransferase involved in cell wall biosynthesis
VAVSCVTGNNDDRYQLDRTLVLESTRLDTATVSVIIPNYNYGRFVAAAIESVLAQTVAPDEVLVIDDASTDDSRDVLRLYENRVQLEHNQRNLGIVGNFRKAVELTTGDYIAFLGADNRMRADYVEKCKAALDAHPDVGVAYTDMSLFGRRAGVLAAVLEQDRAFCIERIYRDDETGEEIYHWRFPDADFANTKRIREHNFVHGSSMYRRSAYEAVGGYQRHRLPEDWDLFARMLESGWKAWRVPYPLIEYRQHSADQANTVHNLELQLAHYVCESQRLKQELSAARTAGRIKRMARWVWGRRPRRAH